jgi:hypothetical protein
MKTKLLLILLLMVGLTSNAQLYINEIFVSPPGTDETFEYVEIRGVPDAVIPAGTYFFGVDGDGDDGSSPGDVEGDIVDLSGLSIGSNGYLVLLSSVPTPHIYTVDPGATVVLNAYDGNFEDQTHTFFLITSAIAPTTSDDIDSDNDGTPDGVYLGWTVHDSISFADNDGILPHDEFAYSNVIFAMETIVTVGTLKYPAGATVIQTTTQYDYAARIGNSTGSVVTNDENTSDWVGGDIPSSTTNPRVWVFSGTSDRVTPNSFSGSELNHIGKQNPTQNTTLSINKVLGSKFSIFPNPANNFITIQSADVKVSSVEIYSLLGQKVLVVDELKNNQINVANLSRGMYLLKISAEGNSVTKKIIIE